MKNNHNKKSSKSSFAASLIVACILVALSAMLFYLLYKSGVKEEKIAKAAPVQGKLNPPSKGAYLGISLSDPNYENLLKLEQKIEKHFAVIGIYQAWGTKSNQFNADLISSLSEHNSIPLITWEPWVQVSGYDRSVDTVDQMEYRLSNITDGKFDKYISTYAMSVKDYKKPIMIRFAHEMNGNWYPWGSAFNTPAEYISAWRHVHDIFERVGAINATWVWSPNEIYYSEQVPYSDQITAFYPGDAYVDWVGFSAFNWAGRYKKNLFRSPDDMYSPTLRRIETLKKPVMITETASADAGGPLKKAGWIKALAKYTMDNPSIKGIVWFNAVDNGIDWQIESTVASTDAFKNSFGDHFVQRIK